MVKRKYNNEEFFKSFSLEPNLIDFNNDVVILPYNNFSSKDKSFKNAFPDSSYYFKKIMEENELAVNFYNPENEKSDLVLRSAEEVLPFLLIFSEPAVAITLNIISNIIYDRFIRGSKSEKFPEIKVEYAYCDHERNATEYRLIEGNAKKVMNILKHDPFYKKLPKEIKYQNHSTVLGNPYAEQSQISYQVAESLISEARIMLKQGLLQASEQLYRRSLDKLCDAYLYDKSQIHYRKQLHQIGLFIHSKFRCKYKFEDGVYSLYCPVRKSHSKGGFSIGGVAKKICSICGKEIHECKHKGRKVDNVVAKKIEGICNICGKRDCLHEPGETYNNVIPIYFITNIEIDHIAYVDNPADPTLVYYNDTIDEKEIMNILPEQDKKEFEYGKSTLYCNHCLDCDGS